ncbi:MAG TPA: hypothetical protein VFH95_04890 [Candidatus Kapabacteria bacterium]|nr:hypothetical protein [Candidatus Kapabacteria bacterium]
MASLFCGAVILLLLVAGRARAQTDSNSFILDQNFSGIAGAADVATVENILVQYEQQAIPQQLFPEDNRGSKILGRLYRFAKTILFENVQDVMATLVQHEVFGHGARVREFGGEASYELHLFPPYGSGHGVTYPSFVGTINQVTAVSIGGIEAEGLLAEELRMRSLGDGTINYRDGYVYMIERAALTTYAWQTHSLDASGGNDIAAYIDLVGIRNPHVTLKNIQTNSLLNLLDPLTLTSLYGYFYDYLIKGDIHVVIPFLKIGGIEYLPGFRVGLTPFGYNYYLENMIVSNHNPVIATIGIGPADLGTSEYVRLQVPAAWSPGRWQLGIELDAWHEPALDLNSELLPSFNPAWNFGGLAIGSVTFRITPTFGLQVEGGYKTQGFVEGEPLAASAIVQGGIVMR